MAEDDPRTLREHAEELRVTATELTDLAEREATPLEEQMSAQPYLEQQTAIGPTATAVTPDESPQRPMTAEEIDAQAQARFHKAAQEGAYGRTPTVEEVMERPQPSFPVTDENAGEMATGIKPWSIWLLIPPCDGHGPITEMRYANGTSWWLEDGWVRFGESEDGIGTVDTAYPERMVLAIYRRVPA